MTNKLPSDTREWVGSIITASGATVDLLEFTPEMVNLEDVAQSLSLTCRYNGHLPNFYSVAEHSVRVSQWLQSAGYDEDIQLTGLLHDAAEAYVGDMVRPLKKVPAIGEVFDRIEEQIAESISVALGGVFPYTPEIHAADRAIYYWEVDAIRSGKQSGWKSEYAKDVFLARYEFLSGVIRV